MGVSVIGRLLDYVRSRPRVHLSIRMRDSPWFGGYIDDWGDAHIRSSGREVVVRVVNDGPVPVAIERLGLELDNGTIAELDGGSILPATITRPEHLEREESRRAMAQRVGATRVLRIVAIATNGHRFTAKVPKKWETTATWPA